MMDFLQSAERLKKDIARLDLPQPPALMLESFAMRFMQIASRSLGVLSWDDLKHFKCYHLLKEEVKRQGKCCTHPFGKVPTLVGGILEVKVSSEDLLTTVGARKSKSPQRKKPTVQRCSCGAPSMFQPHDVFPNPAERVRFLLQNKKKIFKDMGLD